MDLVPSETTPKVAFSFRVPTEHYEEWTDEAIEMLKGQEVSVTREGLPTGFKTTIVDARRYVDPLLGEGIWFSIEMTNEEPEIEEEEDDEHPD